MKSELQKAFPSFSWSEAPDHEKHLIGEHEKCSIELDQREDGNFLVSIQISKCGPGPMDFSSFKITGFSRNGPVESIEQTFQKSLAKMSHIKDFISEISDASKADESEAEELDS